MKRNIKSVVISAALAVTMMVPAAGTLVYADNGPSKGSESFDIYLNSTGPSVPTAGQETALSNDSSAADALSPFSTNVYGTPVNGYYCDAVTTYTYENLQSDIEILKTQFGEYVKSHSLGTTADDRYIYELTVGNSDAENQILLIGAMHGREYITTQLIMRQIHSLLTQAKSGGSINGNTVASLLEKTCIRVIPMDNPDGVTLSQFGEAKVNKAENIPNLRAMINHDKERENYSGNTDWYYRRWKNNINGVDINRNFSIGWEQLDDSRYFPSYEYYKGTVPESEAESVALLNVLNEASIDEVINYHAQGGVIYWSFGAAPDAVETRSRELAELVKAQTGYILGAQSTNKNSVGSGSYKEYLALKGIPSVTIEVGLGSCPLPDTDIDGIWEKNQNVLSSIVYELNNR